MYFNTNYEDRKQGAELIAKIVKKSPSKAGVYRMIDKNGKVLYVGKAKNLKKRLSNYADLKTLNRRISSMVGKTHDIEIITTKSEAEAFLLEANLIKHFQPKYNILLKDDKSFPYILIREEHEFNQITKHRGQKKEKGKYYGPFASAKDVNSTISNLQKIFLIRPCSDSYFNARKRPCIQYDIKRCSAPCVGKISLVNYKELINKTNKFLQGRSEEVRKELIKDMDAASSEMKYEVAASIRDRIKALNSITTSQAINLDSIGDADVIGMYREYGKSSIQLFFFRGGQNFGNKTFFPRHNEDDSDADILIAFLGRIYQKNPPPKNIILPLELEDSKNLEHILSQIAGKKIQLSKPKHGNKLEVLNIANENAKQSLIRKLKEELGKTQLLEKVKELFNLSKTPKRIEVYDNSHISGKHAVGAMIVAGLDGFDKNSYRKFNITGSNLQKVTGGDDYAMLRQVLTRRLKRIITSKIDESDDSWPDLLLIDGGQGHLTIANEVIVEFGLESKINYACIAKGVERNAGKENFFMKDKEPFTLPKDLPVMKYLQILRDEAHRYAITTHRQKRSKAIRTSILNEIPGIGPKRKKLLLEHFGSPDDVINATINDIIQIEGIDKKIAKIIYDYLHEK